MKKVERNVVIYFLSELYVHIYDKSNKKLTPVTLPMDFFFVHTSYNTITFVHIMQVIKNNIFLLSTRHNIQLFTFRSRRTDYRQHLILLPFIMDHIIMP